MEAAKIQGVPTQQRGSHLDVQKECQFRDPQETMESFELLKARFFSINHWKEICGGMSADFRLFDQSGVYVDRMPQEGDFIRVDIPGPGDIYEKGFDWVRIVKIDERIYDGQLERYLILCRPSSAPNSKKNHVAHFYSPQSSSSFLIERGATYIKAGVYGRNELPNYAHTGLMGKIRNFFIYLGGAMRMTKMQWKSLVEGLMDFKNDES